MNPMSQRNPTSLQVKPPTSGNKAFSLLQQQASDLALLQFPPALLRQEHNGWKTSLLLAVDVLLILLLFTGELFSLISDHLMLTKTLPAGTVMAPTTLFHTFSKSTPISPTNLFGSLSLLRRAQILLVSFNSTFLCLKRFLMQLSFKPSKPSSTKLSTGWTTKTLSSDTLGSPSPWVLIYSSLLLNFLTWPTEAHSRRKQLGFQYVFPTLPSPQD